MRAGARGFGVSLGAAAICAYAGTLIAQGPTDRPTFRVASTLIEFTLTAQDAKGHPVTDLRQDEIVLTEKGRPRDVAFFRFEGTQDSVWFEPKPLPAGVFTNRPEYSAGPPRNITAIVVDALNTRPEDQVAVRSQVMAYLNTLPTDARIALYRAGERVQILHDFTDDIASLRARMSGNALEATVQTQVGITVARPETPEFITQSFQRDYLDILDLANKEIARFEELSNQQIQDRRSHLTLASLEALGNHLAGIPGRKSIVWITAGTPTVMLGAGDPWLKTYERAIRDTAQRLASQGVTLYPVEATGLKSPEIGKASASSRGDSRGTVLNPVAARAAAQPQSLVDMSTTPDQRRLPSAMDLFADVTGGRLHRNTNDLTAGLKTAAADLRGSYSLGFYTPQEPDNKWHAFKVQVKRRGVTVLSRQGYLGVAPKQPRVWVAQDWRDAANNPLRSTAVRLDARCTLNGNILSTDVLLTGDDLTFRKADNGLVTDIEVAVAEKTPEGLSGLRHELLSFQIQEKQAEDLSSVRPRFSKQWPIAAPTSIIRLIIYDRSTGRYGTIDVPVSQLRSKPI